MPLSSLHHIFIYDIFVILSSRPVRGLSARIVVVVLVPRFGRRRRLVHVPVPPPVVPLVVVVIVVSAVIVVSPNTLHYLKIYSTLRSDRMEAF